MATAAARVQRRDLGPDWRDRLRQSLRRAAVRTAGAAVLALCAAVAVALATYNTTDPSFSTAAGGPPQNWLGASGAYVSDMLLLLFGLAAGLLLPVVALAGLRLVRLEPVGHFGRALLIALAGTLI